MAFEDLVTHPTIVGQYLPGNTFQYNIDLPVKGTDLQSVFFGLAMTPELAEEEMELRKANFDADQAGVIKPTKWHNIGYVVDATGLTAYFQYEYPEYKFENNKIWSNWPEKPEIIEEV